MKQWLKKLLEQLDLEWGPNGKEGGLSVSEERATILYLIDTYNKHLFEMEQHPIRKTRELLDSFARDLVASDPTRIEKVLFRFRQFFSTYRIDEYAYINRNFEDFKGIIWDFVDQLTEEFDDDATEDKNIMDSLDNLREAVESNSIEELRQSSRLFIDNYIEFQSKKDLRRSKRIKQVKRSLRSVKKKLDRANLSMRLDHLTQAYNRKSFDEQMHDYKKLFELDQTPVTLVMLDIDHFKRVNDTYGHAIGDFVLIECVKMLKDLFAGEQDFVARIGGEEFAVILPEQTMEQGRAKVERALDAIRKEVLVQESMEIRFTVSVGIAQLQNGEDVDTWIKRADAALYKAKTGGRDRWVLADKRLKPLEEFANKAG